MTDDAQAPAPEEDCAADPGADFVPPPPVRLSGIDADAAPPHDIVSDTETAISENAPDPVDEGRSEISALVERIAAFKRNREVGAEPDTTEPRLPLGEDELRSRPQVRAFGFAADAGAPFGFAATNAVRGTVQ